MAEEEDKVDTFLAHYGVAGMKWGVKRAAYVKSNKNKESLANIRDGKGTAKDRLRTGLLTTKKGATKRLAKAEESEKRVEAGQAKVKDLIRLYGNLSTLDLVAQTRK